ncbi:MAG: hypothetical protein QXP04_05170 [Candidatus Nanoarchaeia archaeon]|nr:hypothetical protein [Candidatus Jingweiarchaeum tengchongense]
MQETYPTCSLPRKGETRNENLLDETAVRAYPATAEGGIKMTNEKKWRELISEKEDELIDYINNLYKDTFDSPWGLRVILHDNGKIACVQACTQAQAELDGSAIAICELDAQRIDDIDFDNDTYLNFIKESKLESLYNEYNDDNAYDFLKLNHKLNDFYEYMIDLYVDDFKSSGKAIDLISEAYKRFEDEEE